MRKSVVESTQNPADERGTDVLEKPILAGSEGLL